MITLLPQSTLYGTWTSNLVLVPAAAVTVLLQAVMNLTDVQAPKNIVNLCLGWSFNLSPATLAASIGWRSGYLNQDGYTPGTDPPAFKMPTPQGVIAFSGQVITAQPLDIGLQMDMLDVNGNSLLSFGPRGWSTTIDVPVPPVAVA